MWRCCLILPILECFSSKFDAFFPFSSDC
uniref:Uncharacterized protein n=1 Tax=Rhizophora mucronata TaxID=61149 RepID=A0A2P2MND4_RHIMU